MKKEGRLNTNFIENTAKDYDLPYHIVEHIYRKYQDVNEFYLRLEEYLKMYSSFIAC